MALNPNNIVDQMRLNTGDYIEDEPFLSDAVYMWFYSENGNSVIEGSIEALESIINNISLGPSRWEIGDASESMQSVQSLERRLEALKKRRKGVQSPVIIGSDRKDWDDINNLFRNF